MIWLIGNKGMLGSDVEKLLKKQDIDHLSSDFEVDITDVDCLRGFADKMRIEWLINCAAYTAVDRAEDEAEKAFKINADGAFNIAEIARVIGAKLIHISTDYVFDGDKHEPYTENDAPNPIGVYGKSKLQGEENVLKTTVKHFIIRTEWPYGKNGSNFVHTMFRLFREGVTVKIVSDQWGSPTYTGDLAGSIIKIIAEDSDKFGVYHFTNEGKTNWYEFAVEIYKKAKNYRLLEKDVEIVPIGTAEYPTKAKRPRSSYLLKDKIKAAFGLKIRNWQDALDDYIKEK